MSHIGRVWDAVVPCADTNFGRKTAIERAAHRAFSHARHGRSKLNAQMTLAPLSSSKFFFSMYSRRRRVASNACYHSHSQIRLVNSQAHRTDPILRFTRDEFAGPRHRVVPLSHYSRWWRWRCRFIRRRVRRCMGEWPYTSWCCNITISF